MDYHRRLHLSPFGRELARRCLLLGLVCGFALFVSGCLLSSAEQTSSDAQPGGGNISTSFVSAEGSEERSLETGASLATLNAIVILQAEQGELRLELLNPDGAVALSAQSRPDEQVTKSGSVTTDERGRLRYRVVARGARNGSFQVLYQRMGQ